MIYGWYLCYDFLNCLKIWCARTNCHVVCAMENGVMENARNHGCKQDVWQLVVIGQNAAVTKWVTSDATNWNPIVSVAWRLLIAAKKLVGNVNNQKLKICMQGNNDFVLRKLLSFFYLFIKQQKTSCISCQQNNGN